MLEKQIEQTVKAYARTKNWLAYKWTSPGHAFVPDGLMFNYIPPEHREIVARYVKIVEFKQQGKKPTAGQQREIERLRAHGYDVRVIDNIEEGKGMVDETACLRG
jgi:hypothetical protein